MITEFDAAVKRLRVLLQMLVAENETLKDETRTLHNTNVRLYADKERYREHIDYLKASLLQAPHASWCESLSCRHCVGLDSIQQMEQHAVYHDPDPLPCNCYVRAATEDVK